MYIPLHWAFAIENPVLDAEGSACGYPESEYPVPSTGSLPHTGTHMPWGHDNLTTQQGGLTGGLASYCLAPPVFFLDTTRYLTLKSRTLPYNSTHCHSLLFCVWSKNITYIISFLWNINLYLVMCLFAKQLTKLNTAIKFFNVWIYSYLFFIHAFLPSNFLYIDYLIHLMFKVNIYLNIILY